MSMNTQTKYIELREADYIMKMMREDVFGHRLTAWNPQDTARLHIKLKQPISDEDKEKFVSDVEPLMKRKTYVSPKKDKYLDSFLDLDTRIRQKDIQTTKDPESEKLDKFLGADLT